MLLSENPQAFKDGADRGDPAVWAVERRARADLVERAQTMIGEAIDLIETAVRGTQLEANVDAYVVAHLKMLASGDHGYVSRDQNLDDVMADLRGEDDEFYG